MRPGCLEDVSEPRPARQAGRQAEISPTDSSDNGRTAMIARKIITSKVFHVLIYLAASMPQRPPPPQASRLSGRRYARGQDIWAAGDEIKDAVILLRWMRISAFHILTLVLTNWVRVFDQNSLIALCHPLPTDPGQSQTTRPEQTYYSQWLNTAASVIVL